MTVTRTDQETTATFLYRGERYLWGYSPDRLACGLWSVDDPNGSAERTWPIAEHAEAWEMFRSLEPNAVPYGDEPPTAQEPPLFQEELSAPHAVPTAATAEAEDDLDAGARTELSDKDEVPGEPAKPALLATRPSPRQVGLLVAAAALVVGLVLIGIGQLGSGPKSLDPASAVAAAATKTEGAHSARFNLTMQGSVTPGTVHFTATGVGQADFSGSSASTQMILGGGKLSEVASSGVVYESFPGISKALPGKSWLTVPIGQAGFAGDAGATAADPKRMLEILASGNDTVTSMGPGTIKGVSVNGYLVQVTRPAAESRLSALGSRSATDQSASALLRQVGFLDFRVYVDANQEITQMDFSTSIADGFEHVPVSATVDFMGFGRPVAVSVPPASQVASLAQYLEALGMGSSA